MNKEEKRRYNRWKEKYDREDDTEFIIEFCKRYMIERNCIGFSSPCKYGEGYIEIKWNKK